MLVCKSMCLVDTRGLRLNDLKKKKNNNNKTNKKVFSHY